ncbi:MAG: DUF1580 domain-containing protein [Thermoguttaceae bacterium]
MNDLNEKYLTFKQVAQALPGRVHLSTIHRWRVRGVHGVKLATVKIGGRRMVDASSLAHFIEDVTTAADGQPQPVRTSRQRQRAIEAAERELERECRSIQHASAASAVTQCNNATGRNITASVTPNLRCDL